MWMTAQRAPLCHESRKSMYLKPILSSVAFCPEYETKYFLKHFWGREA